MSRGGKRKPGPGKQLGRNPKPEHERKRSYSVGVTPATLRALDAHCDELGIVGNTPGQRIGRLLERLYGSTAE